MRKVDLMPPLFLRATLKHVANAMQCAEGFVLERALVILILIGTYCHMRYHDTIDPVNLLS